MIWNEMERKPVSSALTHTSSYSVFYKNKLKLFKENVECNSKSIEACIQFYYLNYKNSRQCRNKALWNGKKNDAWNSRCLFVYQWRKTTYCTWLMIEAYLHWDYCISLLLFYFYLLLHHLPQKCVNQFSSLFTNQFNEKNIIRN